MQDDADIPSHIDLQPGESRVVALRQLGAGGYAWTAEVVEGTARVEALPPEGASPAAIGGAVKVGFRVTAGEAGTSVVRFTYGRPWEDTPERTHEVRVRVGDPA